jgi:hypothetical protein
MKLTTIAWSTLELGRPCSRIDEALAGITSRAAWRSGEGADLFQPELHNERQVVLEHDDPLAGTRIDMSSSRGKGCRRSGLVGVPMMNAVADLDIIDQLRQISRMAAAITYTEGRTLPWLWGWVSSR